MDVLILYILFSFLWPIRLFFYILFIFNYLDFIVVHKQDIWLPTVHITCLVCDIFVLVKSLGFLNQYIIVICHYWYSFIFCRNLSEDHAIDGLDLELESVSEVSGSENLSRTSSNNSTDSTFEPVEGSRDPLSGSVPSRDVVANQQNIQRSYAPSMNVNENRLGYMYFQHSEIASPCWRIPLVEKVCKLKFFNN